MDINKCFSAVCTTMFLRTAGEPKALAKEPWFGTIARALSKSAAVALAMMPKSFFHVLSAFVVPNASFVV